MENKKKIYKVLALIPKRDGSGHWFQRIGSAHPNKDDSLNAYLDFVPITASGKGLVLQIRELDEADLRPRATSRANDPHAVTAPTSPSPAAGIAF